MMQKVLRAGRMLAAALTAGLGTVKAQASNWAIDKSHSEADFSVKPMGIGTVHGSFRAVTGMIHFEAGNPASTGRTSGSSGMGHSRAAMR